MIKPLNKPNFKPLSQRLIMTIQDDYNQKLVHIRSNNCKTLFSELKKCLGKIK